MLPNQRTSIFHSMSHTESTISRKFCIPAGGTMPNVLTGPLVARLLDCLSGVRRGTVPGSVPFRWVSRWRMTDQPKLLPVIVAIPALAESSGSTSRLPGGHCKAGGEFEDGVVVACGKGFTVD